jgi:hypothetical protein
MVLFGQLLREAPPAANSHVCTHVLSLATKGVDGPTNQPFIGQAMTTFKMNGRH